LLKPLPFHNLLTEGSPSQQAPNLGGKLLSPQHHLSIHVLEGIVAAALESFLHKGSVALSCLVGVVAKLGQDPGILYPRRLFALAHISPITAPGIPLGPVHHLRPDRIEVDIAAEGD